MSTWGRCTTLILYLAALSGPPATADPQTTPDESFRAVSDFHASIARLSVPELRSTFAARRVDAPRLAFEALILRAGLPTPPGLPSTLSTQRNNRRREALSVLSEVAPTEDGPGYRGHLERVLAAWETRPVLWAAAARVVADLELYELAETVSAGLEVDRDPRERLAAQAALHHLYLRWFDDRPAFMNVLAQVGDRRPEAFFLETGRELERVSRERLERLMELEPERAFQELDADDPRVRRSAARVLGPAAAGGTVEPDQVVAGLLERVEIEQDPEAFDAVLTALHELLAEAPIDSLPLRHLRTGLQARINEGNPDLMSSVAQAIARMPWQETAAGPDSLLRGLEWLSLLLDDLVRREELADGDLFVNVLHSIQTVGERSRAAGLDVRASTRAGRDSLFEVLSRPGGYEEVRVAAAAAVSLFAGEDDAKALVALLAEKPSTDFAYALLGSLARLAARVDPTRPAAQEVRQTLVRQVRNEDANLRRRALDLLDSADLESLAATIPPRLFVDRLAEEPVADLARRLLRLVGRFGHAEELQPLLDSAAFRGLAAGQPAVRSELGAALELLAGGAAGPVMSCGTRLVAEKDPESRSERLALALSLSATMSAEEARKLTQPEHRAVVDWALELRGLGGRTLRQTSDGRHFNHRLLEVHVPGAAGADKAPELAHARALFLGDLLSAGSAIPNENRAAEKGRVIASYETALAHAATDPEKETAAVVRRDRARFYDAMGDGGLALKDYAALMTFPPSAEEGGVEGLPVVWSVLQLSDLRRSSDLVLSALPQNREAPSPPEWGTACDLLHLLVRRPTWPAEPAARRLEDLRQLAERARRSGDVMRLERVLADLEGLPAEPGEAGEPGRLWSGLLADPAAHRSLADLRGELEAELEARRAVGEPEEASADQEKAAKSGSGDA